jgi:hypothetical protein
MLETAFLFSGSESSSNVFPGVCSDGSSRPKPNEPGRGLLFGGRCPCKAPETPNQRLSRQLPLRGVWSDLNWRRKPIPSVGTPIIRHGSADA